MVVEKNILFKILLILVLILLNAFFAASEMAIISLNKSKVSFLAKEGDEKAKLLLKLTKEPSKFLATIQVGITLGGFFASASAATNLSQPLAGVLASMNIPGSNQIALITVTIILAYITLVLGELYPKRMALQNAQKIAMFAVKPILIISKVTTPFVKILTFSTNLLVKISGVSTNDINEKVSREEIRMMISTGEEHGVINDIEKYMIDGIFEFDNTLAKEIMTPRFNVFMLDINLSADKLLARILEEKYSRIPVYEGNIDNIIGIIYMKDLFIESNKGEINHDTIKNLLKPAYFVPETKNIDELFKELQNNKNHIALLIDEYGTFTGIVTIEDLVEEVMGNIFDEHEEKNELISKLDDKSYIVDGFTPIDEINKTLHTNIPSYGFDTIGGFIIDFLGYIPKARDDESIEYDNLILKIDKVKQKRIDKVKILIK
ncbi:hemolysin family protein [Clostridium aestuarii]|uniref:Hemolysin family protein n=1 Tax=Clostridium aestuarii TaxID=338193 RepID=A0ABT4CVD1_9CLOT|nr:hemolysin family protein [Clostridium aestuarii]MCY6482936.1 hemolysin family protein [Clostridium aestuarii]